MKNKKIVYIPTTIEQEFPQDRSVQFELVGNASRKSIGWYIDGNREHAGATHWLKPTEAYVFTQEELEKLLQEYTDMIVENVELDVDNYYKPFVSCDSITSQLPKFLNKLNNE